jgi:hypothetical protein
MKTRLTDPKIEVTFGPLDLTDMVSPYNTQDTVITLSMSQARRLRDAITSAIVKYSDATTAATKDTP